MAAATRFLLRILIACFALSPTLISARSLSNAEYLQMKRHLKSLNKPAVKSIKVDEDIFDCVDIYKQPSFDHPLLKNFTIPAVPKFEMESPSDEAVELGLPDGGCPDGTVPIRRVQMRDLLRSRFSGFGNKYHNRNKISPQADDSQFRTLFIRTMPGDYRGGQATINVWNLPLKNLQYSIASLQVFHGYDSPGSNLSVVQAGWMVNTQIDDSNARLFAFWSGDQARSTGCFNLLCQGFIQLSKKLPLGIKVTPYSEYKGQQRDITILIYVADNGVWWLNVQNETVGFWPPSIFNYKMKNGNIVQWGGDVFNRNFKNGFPPLGSGHFPADGEFNEACYMRQLQVVNSNNELVDAPEGDEVERYNQAPCYGAIDHGNEGSWHRYFFFGGPGGKC